MLVGKRMTPLEILERKERLSRLYSRRKAKETAGVPYWWPSNQPHPQKKSVVLVSQTAKLDSSGFW